MVFTLFRLHTQKKVAIATSRNLIPKNSVLTGENVIVDNNKKNIYFIKTLFETSQPEVVVGVCFAAF